MKLLQLPTGCLKENVDMFTCKYLGSWRMGGHITYMYLYYYTYIIHKFIYQMIPLRLPSLFLTDTLNFPKQNLKYQNEVLSIFFLVLYDKNIHTSLQTSICWLML